MYFIALRVYLPRENTQKIQEEIRILEIRLGKNQGRRTEYTPLKEGKEEKGEKEGKKRRKSDFQIISEMAYTNCHSHSVNTHSLYCILIFIVSK